MEEKLHANTEPIGNVSHDTALGDMRIASACLDYPMIEGLIYITKPKLDKEGGDVGFCYI